MNRNQERSKSGLGPLKYSSILSLAKEITSRAGLPDARLMTGDPYCGRLPEEDAAAKTLKDLVGKVSVLEKRASSQSAQPSRGRGRTGRGMGSRGRGGHNNGMDVSRKKLSLICYKFNSPEGCPRDSCQYFHACRRTLPTGVCGQPHPSHSCPN